MLKYLLVLIKRIALASLTILFIFYSCKPNTAETHRKDQMNSLSMRAIIDSIYQNVNPQFALYDNDRRAELLANQLRKSQNPSLVFNFAKEKLNAGDTKDAIAIIENILQNNPSIREVNERTRMIHQFLGICYLRLAEQNNCLNYHSPESCIVPLKKGGIHIEKEPASRARKIYEDLLHLRPSDYESRWLLNIAYMALGEYPSNVPDSIYIPLSKSSEFDDFPNIAGDLGIDVNGLSGSVIADDFTNDGYLDILASSWGSRGTIKLFVNKGDQGFVDQTAKFGLDSVYGGLNVKQADFNNDGWMDFIILRGAWKPGLAWGVPPNSLMKNNGDGSFSDVTIESGLYSSRPTQSSIWFDYDLDGHIDLFIANETTKSSRQSFPCELFQNQGDGTFVNVAKKLGVDYVGYFKGVVSGDVNNDGRPDLFLSNLSGNNILLQNQYREGELYFKDITESAGVNKPLAAFPAWFFDYNQDGFEDIYVATFDSTAYKDQSGQFAASILGSAVTCEPNALYENQGDGTFMNVTEDQLGSHAISTMGCNYGDLTNSGFPDFYLGTGAPDYRAIVPNRLFVNNEGEGFREATFATHTGHIQKGHGIAFADFNHDGSQEIYAVMGGAFSGDLFHNALYKTPPSEMSWLKLKLVGKTANRAAIGAKIQIHGKRSCGEPMHRYRTVSSGASFGGNPTEVHLGLGDMHIIDSLVIKWPNTNFSTDKFFDLSLNKRYRIAEDEIIERFPIQPYVYPKNGNMHDHGHSM